MAANLPYLSHGTDAEKPPFLPTASPVTQLPLLMGRFSPPNFRASDLLAETEAFLTARDRFDSGE
jgi:hypothetical protein